MSGIFALQGAETPKSNPYNKIGLSRNPFRPQDDLGEDGPFYSGHLGGQLKQIVAWLNAPESPRQPALSIRGTIGVGKSRLLREIDKGLTAEAETRRCYATIVELGDAGFSRPSMGQLLLDAVELVQPDWDEHHESCPPEAIPLVWCVVNSSGPIASDTKIGRALAKAQESKEPDLTVELVRYICRWLRRHPLTPKQSEQTGLYGRVDVSGALPAAIADLLELAANASVLRNLFFMVDQLEELFRDTFSQLQRSRILTDLRMLVDREDTSPGLKLVLTWGPERPVASPSTRDEVEERMKLQYSALYSRLTRNMIAMEQLTETHALPFVETYLKPIRKERGSVSTKEPANLAAMLAGEAWRNATQLSIGQRASVTPRSFLEALASKTDELAGV